MIKERLEKLMAFWFEWLMYWPLTLASRSPSPWIRFSGILIFLPWLFSGFVVTGILFVFLVLVQSVVEFCTGME